VSKLLRLATFLAPNILPVYAFIAGHIGRRLGLQTELVVGTSFDQFAAGDIDAGFICGLPYVQLARVTPPPVTLLAAPVLTGERYAGRPIYFSDVVVRRGDAARGFGDLRGRSWAYNDLDSHSGYTLTRYELVRRGETGGFFRRVVAAGSHQRALRLVARGEVDGSAIDSQVLAVELRDHPELADDLKVIETFGPSTIQPLVAAAHLPEALKSDVRDVVLSMHEDERARDALMGGFIDRFMPVDDEQYDDIRRMLGAAEARGFLTIA
jgi:phosphonate transport system substrate-binding protein